MTITSDTAVPTTTPDERAARLTDAATTWGSRIAGDPATARLTYRVDGAGQGSVATRVTSGHHGFLVDEPGALAGDDVAASPVEYALGALASCQVVVYRLYAHALGIPFDSIDVAAEGDLDVRNLFGISDQERPGFTAVRLHVTLSGPETQERYDELRAAVDAHCPVLDLFANPTPLSVTVTKA